MPGRPAGSSVLEGNQPGPELTSQVSKQNTHPWGEGVRNAMTGVPARAPAALGEDTARYQGEVGDRRMWPGFLHRSA